MSMSPRQSLYQQHDPQSLRNDKLSYQQSCALMAIAQTERKSSNQVLSEMRHEQGLRSGKDLQHDGTLKKTLSDRGYQPLSQGMVQWGNVQKGVLEKGARYFAITYPPNVDTSKGDSIGHAVSVSVSKSGGITVFGNNQDKDSSGNWVGGKSPSTAGGRPFQRLMKPNHQIQLFKPL